MSISEKQLAEFRHRWDEYEDTVTRLLPRSILRGQFDLVDDLDHALFCRDLIEETFAQHPNEPALLAYRTRVLGTDADLILLRRGFFERYPLEAYRATRERAGVPRSHWWWYLDEVETALEGEAVPGSPVSEATAG